MVNVDNKVSLYFCWLLHPGDKDGVTITWNFRACHTATQMPCITCIEYHTKRRSHYSKNKEHQTVGVIKTGNIRENRKRRLGLHLISFNHIAHRRKLLFAIIFAIYLVGVTFSLNMWCPLMSKCHDKRYWLRLSAATRRSSQVFLFCVCLWR